MWTIVVQDWKLGKTILPNEQDVSLYVESSKTQIIIYVHIYLQAYVSQFNVTTGQQGTSLLIQSILNLLNCDNARCSVGQSLNLIEQSQYLSYIKCNDCPTEHLH
jgi:hypothetical protein